MKWYVLTVTERERTTDKPYEPDAQQRLLSAACRVQLLGRALLLVAFVGSCACNVLPLVLDCIALIDLDH